MPPTFKIIFYPRFDYKERVVFDLVSGSHRLMVKQQHLDKIFMKLSRKQRIKNSDSEFICFDSSIVHGAVANAEEDHSMRVVYNFNLESQLKDGHPNGAASREYYKEKLKEYKVTR